MWWHQGNQGATVSQNGCLRIFGKCLGFTKEAKIVLINGKNVLEVKPEQYSRWELGGEIPRKTPPRLYTINIYNGYGWAEAGKIEVKANTVRLRYL